MICSLWCSLFLALYVSSTAGTIGTLIPVVTANTVGQVAPPSPPSMATVITNQSTGLSTYTNELYGITFDFPPDWIIDTSKASQNTLIFIRPAYEEYNKIPGTNMQGDATGFSVSVSSPTITSYLDPNDLQAKTYTWTARDYALSEKELDAWSTNTTAAPSESWAGSIMSHFYGKLTYVYVKDNPIMVSNETNAWRLDTITNDDAAQAVQIGFSSDVFIIHDNVLYRLNFHTEPLKVPINLPRVEEIVKSFRFI